MNYEELLESREKGKLRRTRLPIGDFYKKQIDGKYHNIVEIDPRLNENIVFSEALKRECEANARIFSNHQLHYTPQLEGDDIKSLELEKGTYLSFEQLLRDHPSIIATKNFVDNTVKDLLELTALLHKQGIYHVCYSPKTVFARQGDNGAMLLSHGSFYFGMTDPMQLYSGFEEYVAPEVLRRGTIDQRCDVYSIGKFIGSLFDTMEIPLEYKQVVQRATSEAPEDRYQTPEDMLRALQTRRNVWRSALTVVGALVVALLGVGLYFELFPETEPVEFVKPAPRQATDDLLDDGFDPAELGVVSGDSSSLSPEDLQSQREYEAKAEEIFRKQFEEAADRILSKVYNKDYMNASEKNFLTQSQSMTDELVSAQVEIATRAGITETRSQVLASEIIERLTNQKRAALGQTQQGIQK